MYILEVVRFSCVYHTAWGIFASNVIPSLRIMATLTIVLNALSTELSVTNNRNFSSGHPFRVGTISTLFNLAVSGEIEKGEGHGGSLR